MLDAANAISLPAVCRELISISTIAENYGQLTGVLAGFAFTALVLLLSSARAEGVSRDRLTGGGVPLVLFVAFITLIINTLMYSVLSGDTGETSRPRASSVQIVNGLSFGLSVLLLFQGITLLVRGAQLDRATIGAARFITVAITPSLAMYFIAGGTTDSESARAQLAGTCASAKPPFEGVILSVAVLILLSISLSSRVQTLAAGIGPVAIVAAPVAVLVATIAGAIACADISTRSPQFLFSPAATVWYLRGAFAVLLAVGLMLSFSVSAPARAAEDSGSATVVQQRRLALPRRASRKRVRTRTWPPPTQRPGQIGPVADPAVNQE